MHWAQLYFTEAQLLSHSWRLERNKKSILPSKAPEWHTSFPPVHADRGDFSLSYSICCDRQKTSPLSTLLREATRGKSKGQADASSYLFPTLTPLSSLHLPLYFINVSAWLFMSLQPLIISSTGSTAPFM